MTFEYCQFLTYADRYPVSNEYWARIPITIDFKNNTSETDANGFKVTVRWFEYVGTTRNTQGHEYISRYAVSAGARTTGHIEIYIPESEFTNPRRVLTDGATFTLEWMRNNTVLSTDIINFKIFGYNGYVYWRYNVPKPFIGETYPLTNKVFSSGTYLEDYSYDSSGSPIVWRNQYNGIKPGEWAEGIIYSYDTGIYYTFQEAYSAGILSRDSSVTSYVNDDPENMQRINGKFIAIIQSNGFLKGGEYAIGVRWYYQETGGTSGVYPSNEATSSPYFTVYEPFAGAALEISAIYPAKYAYGSSEPLRGIPPYTVYVYDGTYTRRNKYTVPVTSITIDWGDPSNPGNITTITYPGTSYISIPPHTYTDTNSHTITMTCVDALGNTTTAEVQFVPSTDPRIITRPTLNGYNSGSSISMNYPALMQGVAENAGNPMPTVTWTYSLQNDPGYYSGSKTGEYTEFSLLAQGRYTVTAVVKNGSTTLGSYSWTVTVGAEPVSTDPDLQMEDFALIVHDNSDDTVPTLVDYCKVHTCPQYTENFQDLDTVSFELPADYEYAKYLKEGNTFLFGHNKTAHLMQVTYRNIKDGVMTVSGENVFPKRVAVYATRSLSDGGYDVQKCSAEALIRYFVYTSRQPDPYNGVYRGADFALHGTNQDLPTGGAQVTYSARFDNTLDIVNSICKTAGIGYRIASRNLGNHVITSNQMWILQGTNRTYSSGGANAVIFSEKLKNCIIESDQSALTSNIAVTAGAGVGYIRDHSFYDINGNLNQTNITGFGRREVFVDAGDSADAAEQKRMAMYELREEQALSITLQVLPTCQWKYGTDYNVGDTVSVWLDSRGGLVDLQIYSADHVQRESGEELHLRLGSRAQTAPALIASNERKNTYARK